MLEAIRKYDSVINQLNDEKYRILAAAVDILGNIYGVDGSESLNKALKPKSAEGVKSMLTDVIATNRSAAPPPAVIQINHQG